MIIPCEYLRNSKRANKYYLRNAWKIFLELEFHTYFGLNCILYGTLLEEAICVKKNILQCLWCMMKPSNVRNWYTRGLNMFLIMPFHWNYILLIGTYLCLSYLMICRIFKHAMIIYKSYVCNYFMELVLRMMTIIDALGRSINWSALRCRCAWSPYLKKNFKIISLQYRIDLFVNLDI